jgi:hypothetical protein
VQHLQKLPYEDPIENQTHYVVAVRTGAKRAYMITTSLKAIVDWQNEERVKQPATRFLIQAFPNASTAKLFAKSMAKAL